MLKRTTNHLLPAVRRVEVAAAPVLGVRGLRALRAEGPGRRVVRGEGGHCAVPIVVVGGRHRGHKELGLGEAARTAS